MTDTVRHYNGWLIYSVGGHITLKRFVARKGNMWHWAFRLKNCKEFCDIRDNGKEIHKLYLESLYV